MFNKVYSGVYTSRDYFMGKVIPYSSSCHQPLRTFHTHTHTHTDTHTHTLRGLPISPVFSKCTQTWQPSPFSPHLWLLCMLHQIDFSSKTLDECICLSPPVLTPS